ncbi:MAG: hypothetical protein PVJ33_14150 [Lysobacterales bacterium]|jgi:hypothetical protein
MKRILMTGTLFLAALLAGPAFSHHAAEGIVSDDIWQMIDLNLQEADSPHLNIDFDAVMGNMSLAMGDDGDMYLVSGITVYTHEVDEYMPYIEAALEEARSLPSGATSSGRASTAFIEVIDLGNGDSEILLFEPIGNGASQDVPTPTTPPGKRS